MFTRLESEQLQGPTVYTAEAEPLPHNFSPLPMPCLVYGGACQVMIN